MVDLRLFWSIVDQKLQRKSRVILLWSDASMYEDREVFSRSKEYSSLLKPHLTSSFMMPSLLKIFKETSHIFVLGVSVDYGSNISIDV